MRVSRILPRIVVIPDIITESELDSLLSSLNYSNVADAQKTILLKEVSGIVYRATGQLFKETELTITYDGLSDGNRVILPYRLIDLTSLVVDGIDIIDNNTAYYIYDDHVYLTAPASISRNNVTLVGNFGYTPTEGIPNDIMLAIKYLLEDMTFGDKFDRLMSRASKMKIDKLEFTRSSGYGNSTGNEDADRLLAPYIWENSPIIKNVEKSTSTVKYSVI